MVKVRDVESIELGAPARTPVRKLHDINQIFEIIGEIGRYQLIMFVLIGLTCSLPAWFTYSYVFNAATPEFRCKLPGYENDTFEIHSEAHGLLVDYFIPEASKDLTVNRYDGCHYKLYESPVVKNSSELEEERSSQANNFTLVACSEYVYSQQFYQQTAVTKWNLVCTNMSLKSLFLTLNFIGNMFSFLIGILSDKVGRKKTIYIMICINTFLMGLHAVFTNFLNDSPQTQQVLFGILRFVSGMSANFYTVALVLAIEVIGPSYRASSGSCVYYFFILGELINSFTNYLERDFARYYIWMVVILCVFIAYFWIVPESPRYLMVKGRRREAFSIFHRIAKSNKKDHLIDWKDDDDSADKVTPMPDQTDMSKADSQSSKSEAKFFRSLKLFFKSKKVIVHSIIILINWMVNSLVYYGISLNTGVLAGDPYLNATYSALVELLAIMTCHFSIGRFGRKYPYSLMMLLAGVSLIVIQFIPASLPTLVTVLALISKFAISFTYNAIYIVTAESFPTQIRSSLLSLCSSSARIASACAPYIQLLGVLYWYALPFLIFGIASFIAAVFYLVFLPETKENQFSDHLGDPAESEKK